ncbi:MAG: hypothetical protein K0S88_2113 [Actinomycetia bacterium]|nr:hypothetical protein [Actinomycetes bacterium]
MLATGLSCIAAGDLTYALYERVLHQSAPFPSLADVLYLAGCPLIGLSLIGIVRTRTAGRDRVSWIDATIVATGFGLLSWVFLMAPTASSNDLPWFGRLVALAYPVWDVLFLALLVRLLAGLGRACRRCGCWRDRDQRRLDVAVPGRSPADRRTGPAGGRAVRAARRDGVPLAVAILDLDHFKDFNDQHGHQAGDRLLKSATSAWSRTLRTTDLLCRYGGEEFGVLLPAATTDQAAEVLERLRAVTPQGQTFSAGLAGWDGQAVSDELVARADRALYAAKAAHPC